MTGAVPVSGSIDSNSFPFLVMDLHRNGATGSLKVDGPAYQKALYFRGGRILFGSSNDPRDQLGSILIDAGKLTPEQLEEVNAKVGPGSPLAKVLAESGLVTQQELGEAARAKVERILGDVLAYAEGSFEFEDGVLPKGAVDLKLHTDRLVLGAVKRIPDRAFVLGHLGSLGVVLAPTSEMAARAADVRMDAGGLVDQLDGRRTLKEAIGQTPIEEFEAAKIACALLFLGLIARTAQDEAAPAASRAADESAFFVPDSADTVAGGDDAFDLGATARMALADEDVPGEEEPPPARAESAQPSGLAFEDEDEPPSVPLRESAEPSAPLFVPAAPGEFGSSSRVALDPIPAPPEPERAPVILPPMPPAEPPPGPSPVSAGAVGRYSTGTPTAESEPVGAAAYPEILPPSSSDLRALDTLLAKSQSEPLRPAGPARMPSRDIPRFVPQGSGARARGGGAKKAGAFLAFLLVLAAVGGAGWYFGLIPSIPLNPNPRGTGTTDASPLPPPTLATQPAAGPSSTPTRDAAPAPTPAPSAAPPPTVAQPIAAPTAPPARSGAPTSGVSASELLRAGRFVESGRASLTHLRGLGPRFTVQILVACSEETLHKALANVPSPELFIVPVKLKGRDCHRLCWGVFETQTSADAADRELPPYFRGGGAVPRVVPVSAIIP